MMVDHVGVLRQTSWLSAAERRRSVAAVITRSVPAAMRVKLVHEPDPVRWTVWLTITRLPP